MRIILNYIIMRNSTNISNNREQIIAIIADVTDCSTKRIWGGTKIEKVFASLGDEDVWLYLEFCDRLEQAFSVHIPFEERLDILDSSLLGLEIRIADKIAQNALRQFV